MNEPRKEKEHEVVYSHLADRTSEPQSEDATELTAATLAEKIWIRNSKKEEKNMQKC